MDLTIKDPSRAAEVGQAGCSIEDCHGHNLCKAKRYDKDLATAELPITQDMMHSKLAELFNAIAIDPSGDFTIGEIEPKLRKSDTLTFRRSLSIDVEDAWTLLELLDW